MAHLNTARSARKGLHSLLATAAVAVIVASAAVVGTSLHLWPSVGAQDGALIAGKPITCLGKTPLTPTYAGAHYVPIRR